MSEIDNRVQIKILRYAHRPDIWLIEIDIVGEGLFFEEGCSDYINAAKEAVLKRAELYKGLFKNAEIIIEKEKQ